MTNQQTQPPQPEPPERPDSQSGAFWRAWFDRLGELATVDVVNATATLVIAERQAAREDEREQIIKVLADYEDQCGETAKRFADLTDDPTDERMYWRADGAADSMEHLIAAIRSRSEHVGE